MQQKFQIYWAVCFGASCHTYGLPGTILPSFFVETALVAALKKCLQNYFKNILLFIHEKHKFTLNYKINVDDALKKLLHK